MIARRAPELLRSLARVRGVGWSGAYLSCDEVEALAASTGSMRADGNPDYERLAAVVALRLGWAWRALWADVPATGGMCMARVEGSA